MNNQAISTGRNFNFVTTNTPDLPYQAPTDQIIYSTFVPTTYSQEDLEADLEAIFSTPWITSWKTMPLQETVATVWNDTVEIAIEDTLDAILEAQDAELGEQIALHTALYEMATSDVNHMIDRWVEVDGAVNPLDVLPRWDDCSPISLLCDDTLRVQTFSAYHATCVMLVI